MPPRPRRKQIPRCCPQCQVPSSGVPGKQDCRRIYQSPGGFRDQPGQDIDRSGDIVKGSRPATADLTSPAVFGHADRMSRVGQR